MKLFLYLVLGSIGFLVLSLGLMLIWPIRNTKDFQWFEFEIDSLTGTHHGVVRFRPILKPKKVDQKT